MLKKLYKHEFHSLFRNLLPIWAALIGFAALSRLTFILDFDNNVLNTVRGLSVTAYIFAIIAVFIVGLVIVVMRFYKNLLTHEDQSAVSEMDVFLNGFDTKAQVVSRAAVGGKRKSARLGA